jgi:hypothetical protein
LSNILEDVMATTARVIDLDDFRRRRTALAEVTSDAKPTSPLHPAAAAQAVVWVPVWVWMPVWSVGM